MRNMRFKVGDRVRIKSIDWYNENKDEYGYIDYGTYAFFPCMSQFCGKTFEIAEVHSNCYNVKEVYAKTLQWTDEMIEGLVEEETYDFLKTDKPNRPSLNDFMDMLNNEIKLPEGYQFVDENGNVINATKIVLEKKKKEYPKTYEECCKIMQVARHTIWFDYDDVSSISKEGDEYECHIENTLCAFRKLLICRDTYYQIAGQEMGLDEPWEPDWSDTSIKYCLERDFDVVNKNVSNHKGHTFAFPTAEMRDAFYENFKEEIEICKELL